MRADESAQSNLHALQGAGLHRNGRDGQTAVAPFPSRLAEPAADRALSYPSAKDNAPEAEGPKPASAEERRRLIAEAAYKRAEKRGFRGGSPQNDWLEAEAEIDAKLRRFETRR